MRTISRGSLGWQSVRSTVHDSLYGFDSDGKVVPILCQSDIQLGTAPPVGTVRDGKQWGDLLRRGRRRRGLSPRQSDDVREVMRASLGHAAYGLAAKPLLVSPDYDDDENFRQYQVHWLASMLADIRVGMLDPNRLSATDWEQLSRIVETFLRVPESPQRKIIRQFFSLRIPLREIAKTGKVGPAVHSDATRQGILETKFLRGRRLAEALTTLGVDHWSPLTPLQAYERDSAAFSRDVYTLRCNVGVHARPR